MLYFNHYIDIFANWIKNNGLYLSAIIFIGTIVLSWWKKKPQYNHKLLDILQPPKGSRSRASATRSVSALTKKIVASNQKWVCADCGIILDYSYEVDHSVPLFKGGSNSQNNLVALCRNCHGRKTILEKLD